MPADSPSTWWWTPADSDRSPAMWKLLPDSESRLLQHAHDESWDRLELDIEGTLYVIYPFSSNAQTHIAVPLGNEGGPEAVITRANDAEDEPKIPLQLGFRGLTFCYRMTLKMNQRYLCNLVSDGTTLVSQASPQVTPLQLWIHQGAPYPPYDAIPELLPTLNFEMHDDSECTMSKLVRRGQVTLPARRPARVSQMAMWRAFPKVDFEACDDYHVVRRVLVDGVDIALHHGGKRKLSPAGIAIAVAHFVELSFPVRVVVPQWLALMHKEHCNLFTESPEALLEALKDDDLLVVLPDPGGTNWRPSRTQLKAASDAEYTVELCKTVDAAYCSNDFNQFLQLLDGSTSRYDDYLYMTTRSCLYTFDGDNFYHVLDSLGRGKFVDGLFFRHRTT
ncbi:LOW QUALITY PROTEIN: uncharacterized protein EMH_0014050 [Eimeria mitis]|uniref:RNase NYN domain-containing protein n=1 Tax=Eimeria mitis TaxID=44415 RepID=U6KBP4_9EIME|nr:LOW QUALITY PROTEIN: uncharacterized protein EMH_0014050 [Eimeria mitis]CDJ32888.1 hypothetical protein, conserved [Eimeria mitis]